jgi:purine-binding chemotaxis protein CheW
METPFLEIPEEQLSLPQDWEDESGLDLFDISYLRGLTEPAKTGPAGEKHIVFTSGGKTFGVSLADVTEVCRSLPIAPLPNVPEWLAGITNLRGDLLAVIDPDVAIEQPAADSAKTKIIVLTDGKRLVGLLVDQINEITLLSAGKITPASVSDDGGLVSFSAGTSEYRNSFLMVLDTKRIFSWRELNELGG